MSTTCLHGEAKTASGGSVSRVPAADIEDTIAQSLKEHLALKQHLAAKREGSTISGLPLRDRNTLAELIAWFVVHRDRLVVRFKSDQTDEASIAQMTSCLRYPGRSRHPKDRAGYYSRTTHLAVTFGRSSLSAGRA